MDIVPGCVYFHVRNMVVAYRIKFPIVIFITTVWVLLTGCGNSDNINDPVCPSINTGSVCDPVNSTNETRLEPDAIEISVDQLEEEIPLTDPTCIIHTDKPEAPDLWNTGTSSTGDLSFPDLFAPDNRTIWQSAIPYGSGTLESFTPETQFSPYSQIQMLPIPPLVPVSCYPDIATEGTPVGSEGYSVRECICFAQQLRIRQDGVIYMIEMYAEDLTDTDRLILTIWRQYGDTFFRFAESENLIGHLVPNQVNEVMLNEPITGVLEGDFYGFRIHQSGMEVRTQLVRSDVYHGHIFWKNENAGDSDVDWFGGHDDASPHGRGITARLYMRPPDIVAIGDSIVSGHPHHTSFIEPIHRTNIEASFPYWVRTQLGVSSQTMGIGNTSIGEIEARFAADCVNLRPRVAIIEGGIKDLNLGTSTADYLTSWENVLDQCEKGGIQAIVLGILPWTSGSDSQMIRRDALNAMVSDLVKSYDGYLFVDTDTIIGTHRVGGEPGNLWDIRDQYDCDGIHYTQQGYYKIASAVVDAIIHQ